MRDEARATLGAADSFPGEGEVAVLLSSSATKLDVPRAGGLTDCHALDPALGPCVCPANWRRGRVSAPIVRNVVGAVEQEAKPPKDSVVTVPARVFGVVGGQNQIHRLCWLGPPTQNQVHELCWLEPLPPRSGADEEVSK
ncbi:hypothetical protein CB1_000273010 [Camelus ferus]|nr:hypothetical protein CB1_000273010 [Camelus ferus]